MSPQPLPLEAPRTRIAIVDDDDLFRESLGLNLAEEGGRLVPMSGLADFDCWLADSEHLPG